MKNPIAPTKRAMGIPNLSNFIAESNLLPRVKRIPIIPSKPKERTNVGIALVLYRSSKPKNDRLIYQQAYGSK